MSLIDLFRRRPSLWIPLACVALLLVIGTVVLAVLFAPATVDAIALDTAELTFSSLTQTHQLVAQTEPTGISPRRLIWSSSDPSVATVSSTGLVTPVGEGQAVITVRGALGAGIAHCSVSVSPISSLVFSQHEVTVAIGFTRALTILSEPQDVDPSLLTWLSSDPSVASVDNMGTVTGIAPGTVRITVASPDGTVTDSCTVMVLQNVPIEGVAFNITEFTFTEPDDSLTLIPIFTPTHTSQRDLVWISSDERVATVDGETGKVTANSNGTAVITAMSPYGDFVATCTVTVAQNIPLNGISLSTDSFTFTALGQIYLISPVFDPVNASNKNMVWTSSDPSVATVSDSGVVTSVKRGSCVITMVTEDGGFTAEFKIVVSPSDRIPVTGVKLSDYSVSLGSIGSTYQLNGSVVPSNATEKGVRYVSKNTSVVKVSSTGLITAVGYGTTQIVVTSAEGGYSENCTVTVTKPIVEAPSESVGLDYVKGAWVATVANINFPSKVGLSADQLKSEIDTIMNNMVSWGLNTVYFQVRPSGDALYPSQYYPSSYYVVKNQGDALPLDILEYAIQAAHSRGLEFHAWINPYRVTNASSIQLSDLASSNPAVANPDWVLTDGQKYYLNPGLPQVRKHILDGVMEIVRNYDVDGIHFDDYFYPDVTSSWDDSAAYAAYGNGLSLSDWRRSNNDALIKDVYSAIKTYDSSVSFGISPAAVWALSDYEEGGVDVKAAYQTYSQAFADTKKWVENEWLDYICPQVYFQMNHSTAPFKPIVDWWNDLVANTDVSLYIGIGAYRCADTDAYKTGTEIPAQLDYLDTKKNVSGAVFYSYGSLLSNFAGVGDQVRERYYKEPISKTLQFNQSSITVDSSFRTTYVVGVSDPNYPLYADGNLVERTPEGYFSYKVTLSGTKTVVRFTHKDQSVDYEITRTSSSTGSGNDMQSFGFVNGSFTPSYDVADKSGVQISFSCVAPAGSEVKVQIGSYRVDLTTATQDPGNKYLKATYTGTLTLPQIDGNKNATLGYPIFYATRGSESASYAPGCLVEVINDPLSYAMEVISDKSDIRPNLEVDPTLYYIATEGAKVHIVSKADGTVKLTNGMYLSTEDVSPLKKTFGAAKVNSAALNVTKKYTVLSLNMTECAFHTVWMDSDYVEVTLYNLSGEIPSFSLGQNPLFSAVTVDRIDSSTVRITLTYKNAMHIYGYYCNFDGTTLYVNFRNPVTLSAGSQPLSGVVVSLDPGHSQNVGAVRQHNGKDVYEADLNLKLSLKTAEKLRAMGATVVLTHQGEQTYSLDELIVQYRALSPDANVSIHFNTAESLATGTETFWCYGNSQLLGEKVLSTFTQQTGFRYRKNACDYYKVSRLCEFPSILFETAFMSNPGDLAYFMDDSNMDFAAQCIANGILAFFQEQNN